MLHMVKLGEGNSIICFSISSFRKADRKFINSNDVHPENILDKYIALEVLKFDKSKYFKEEQPAKTSVKPLTPLTSKLDKSKDFNEEQF